MTSAIIRPITALLLSTALVLMGSGLIGVLIPIRANALSFSDLSIGLIGSGYWAGLVIGCIVAPAIIRRVGHIRAFTAFTATVTVTPLLLAMTSDPASWTALRLLNGLCFAGIQMVIESWLAASSTSQTRGRTLAVYTILNMTVITIGMQLINLAPITSFVLFSLIAVLFSLSAVPIALTLTPPPPPPRSTRIRPLWLLKTSPAAMIGCFSTGLVGGIFWGLAPLYGTANELPPASSATLMTIVVLTGALAQWPIGVLSDTSGRRAALVTTSLIAAAAAFSMTFAPALGQWAIFAAAAAYGTVAFAGYPISLAHANDLVPARRAVMVSSGLLLTYAAGAVTAPLLASGITSAIGADKLFAISAVIHLAAAIAVAIRLGLRPPEPKPYHDDFVSLPRTTPAVFELDPRTDEAGHEPANLQSKE